MFTFDHVVEKLQVGNIELAHLLKNLLDVQVAKLGKVLMEVFWNGFASWFDDSVPLDAIKVFWKGNLVHDEVVLHGFSSVKF